MLRNPNSVSAAISAGIPNQLTQLLVDSPISVVREKASEGLCHFAGYAVGRTFLIESDLVLRISSKVIRLTDLFGLFGRLLFTGRLCC